VGIGRDDFRLGRNPVDGVFDDRHVDRTDVTHPLRDDDVRLEVGERFDINIVDAALGVGGLEDLSIDLAARARSIDPRACDGGRVRGVRRVVALVGDADRFAVERGHRLGRRGVS